MDLMWSDFVNSQWNDWKGSGRPSENRLLYTEWQDSFLAKWNLTAPIPAQTNDIDTLITFRETLRSFVEHFAADGEITDDIVHSLNEFMTLGTVTRQLLRDDDSYRIWLKPDHGAWTQVIAEIAADFTQTLLESNGSRFRICDNLDCKWVFYDDTRNRVKRFCEDKTCGNLMKVRRFRAKKKEEARDN